MALGVVKDYESTWYLDELLSSTDVSDLGLPDALKSVEKFRRKLNADKERISSLSDTTKKKALIKTGLVSDDVRPKDVLTKFQDLYKSKYGVSPPLGEESAKDNKFATAYVYIGRAIKWSSSNQEVIDVMSFMFENWDELRSSIGLDGRPTLNMIGSSRLYPRFISCMQDGIPKRRAKYDRSGITDRYDGESEDVGW
jgi:hypothetical protein